MLSLVLTIVLIVKLEKKQEEIILQDREGFYKWLDNQEQQDKADFMDTFIVLVEDDNTNLYHKFGCDRFKGDYFWAYNIDAAKESGFNPCPLCND